MAAQSVKIPVELEIQNLQGEIARMRKLLGELKPNTKAFSGLEKRIDKISHSLISLETRSKQTFSTQGEISNFSKAFDKIGLAIQDIYTEFQHLDFKDLQLSDADPGVQKLKNFGQQIENVQKKIKDIDFEILGDNSIISQETLKTLKQLDPTFDATQTSIESCFQTLSQELKRVNSEITASVNEVKKLEAAYDKAQKEHADAATARGNLEVDRRNAGKNVVYAKNAKKNQDLAGARAIALQLQIEKKELDKVSESYLSSLTEEKRLQTINEFFDKVINRAELKNQELINKLNDAARKVNELEAKENEALQKWNNEDNRGKQLEAEKQSIQTAETNLKIGEQESINRVQVYITQIQDLTQRVQELEEQLRQNNTVTQQSEIGTRKAVETLGEYDQKAEQTSQQLNHLNEAQERLNNVQYGIKQWFGFHEVINLSKNAVRDAINHIRELDKVMTEIAVVTDMTQKDLWNQMNAYSTMAKEYGSSIKGVYEVSQLWYQQGLQTNEVMKLTEETLKMVKIAGIDYSKATDYMTVALRGFKMEMEDAQRVVDVYSRIAAITASDTQELAEAMSKTASSAEAVGSSFENTTAMIALMVNFLPLIIERLY